MSAAAGMLLPCRHCATRKQKLGIILNFEGGEFVFTTKNIVCIFLSLKAVLMDILNFFLQQKEIYSPHFSKNDIHVGMIFSNSR